MERESIEFRGKLYHRYPESKHLHLRKYFQANRVFLHRVAFTVFVGPIPKGHDVHHRRADTFQDSPGNLEAKLASAHRSEHALSRKPVKMECDECHRKFTSTVPWKTRFCSGKCKAAWRRHSGCDDVKKRCLHCRKSFVRNRYEEVSFCSKSCAVKDSWEKRREIM